MIFLRFKSNLVSIVSDRYISIDALGDEYRLFSSGTHSSDNLTDPVLQVSYEKIR